MRMKILFYSAGPGRGLLGRRARKYERRGFKRCELVEQTRRPRRADLIYVRNIPERTSDEQRSRMLQFLEGLSPATPILNHPRSMLLHDSKDRTFAAWRTAGIGVPDYLVSPTPQELLEFARRHPRLVCRVNNQACGNDTVVLDTPSQEELLLAWQEVVTRAEMARAGGRADTRPMVVAFVDSADSHGFLHSLRVFVVGDLVYGGFALISRQPIINHATSLAAAGEQEEAFLGVSSRLDTLLDDRSFCSKVVRAVQVLGLDVGCLDFVIPAHDSSGICLLEANALWTPSFSYAGGSAGRQAFRSNRERWQRCAGSYCRWMDRVTFYRGMYDAFSRFLESPTTNRSRERGGDASMLWSGS